MSVELNENSMGDLLKEFDVKRINSGDILKGQIIDVNDKEATVNINYAFDGVIAKEELVIGYISPVDVVKPGDILDVYVISPNDGEGYVSLRPFQHLICRKFSVQSGIHILQTGGNQSAGNNIEP